MHYPSNPVTSDLDNLPLQADSIIDGSFSGLGTTATGTALVATLHGLCFFHLNRLRREIEECATPGPSFYRLVLSRVEHTGNDPEHPSARSTFACELRPPEGPEASTLPFDALLEAARAYLHDVVVPIVRASQTMGLSGDCDRCDGARHEVQVSAPVHATDISLELDRAAKVQAPGPAIHAWMTRGRGNALILVLKGPGMREQIVLSHTDSAKLFALGVPCDDEGAAVPVASINPRFGSRLNGARLDVRLIAGGKLVTASLSLGRKRDLNLSTAMRFVIQHGCAPVHE